MKNTKMYAGYRYPPQVISHAVWLYHRFTLSFRDVEELLAARGISVSYETVRNWCIKFGNQYCSQIRKKRGQLGDMWYLDEIFIKINDVLHHLWRAVGQDGDELDILVQKRRNKKAAMKFFKKLLKCQQATPLKIVTDKLRSYWAARREIMPSVAHSTQQHENNHCELSHQPGRQQERQMWRFKSHGQAQRFLSCHGIVNNLFCIGGHKMQADNYRILRERAFSE
ncbi:transposase [Glaciecola punicea]|uniref:IS6 family transposase n=1 Tax=Glaciecola punicea TaxID=56804 RepID=UPI0008723CEF|nr:IS6 family transposase [Glaciecola punicea]OFA29684.1 transposase [Glaciecola punicea]